MEYLINFAKKVLSIMIAVIAAFIGSIPHYIRLICEEIREHRNDIKKLKLIGKRSGKKFFYPQNLLKQMLAIHDYEHLSHDKFIDYKKGLCEELYGNEILQIKIRCNGEELTKKLPYKEIINYTDRCDKENDGNLIKLDSTLEQAKLQLPDELYAATEQILYDFKQERPDTEDNPAIGIHSLESDGKGGYKCQLKKLTYFDAVRTNQTLDTPLDIPNHMHHTTVREWDASKDKTLKPFSESILANQIGVSAVWYMHCPGEHHKERLQFFLKGRKAKLGIFTKMMGTISGTAQPPQEGFSDFQYLEKYATNEMLRIFKRSTCIDKYMVDYAYPKQELEITKLAFTRELMRGGLPQFFFLIKTPYISNENFSEYYRNSPENRKKYRRRPNALTPNMSPETVANFLFAFRHLQQNRHLDYIDLDD